MWLSNRQSEISPATGGVCRTDRTRPAAFENVMQELQVDEEEALACSDDELTVIPEELTVLPGEHQAPSKPSTESNDEVEGRLLAEEKGKTRAEPAESK